MPLPPALGPAWGDPEEMRGGVAACLNWYHQPHAPDTPNTRFSAYAPLGKSRSLIAGSDESDMCNPPIQGFYAGATSDQVLQQVLTDMAQESTDERYSRTGRANDRNVYYDMTSRRPASVQSYRKYGNTPRYDGRATPTGRFVGQSYHRYDANPRSNYVYEGENIRDLATPIDYDTPRTTYRAGTPVITSRAATPSNTMTEREIKITIKETEGGGEPLTTTRANILSPTPRLRSQREQILDGRRRRVVRFDPEIGIVPQQYTERNGIIRKPPIYPERYGTGRGNGYNTVGGRRVTFTANQTPRHAPLQDDWRDNMPLLRYKGTAPNVTRFNRTWDS